MAASSPMDSVTSFGETVKVSPAVIYGMSMGDRNSGILQTTKHAESQKCEDDENAS